MACKKLVRIVTLIIVIMLTLCAGCKSTERQPETQKPNYQLNCETLSMYLDDTFDLVVNNNDKLEQVVWQSTDVRIATVSSNGKVTAKSQGIATVYATVDGITLTCAIEVSVRQDGVAFVDLLNEVKTEGKYVFNLPVGDEYELTPVLRAGVIVDGVQFNLSTEDANLIIDGLTIKAIQEVSSVEVEISCTWENAEYSLIVIVNAIQVG
jgi:uncharacterized protein YjdB